MYDDIKQQFKRVISYSQGIEDPKVDKLFDIWEQSKARFIERFGGLIYEWPEVVEFTLDPKDKKSKATYFADMIYDRYHNRELSLFLDANIDAFFDNVVIDNGPRTDIPKGMKLIKAFKFFEKDKDILTDIQNKASQYIQENKIKGKLCFSVHPLDFLSSSENNYHWRSCHSLDGEFRAGNLSYMCDSTTFMVYLKGADNEILPNFPSDVPWNSKKWRVLMHAKQDDLMMFAGRQYPFNSKVGLDTVLNLYNNIMVEKTERHHFWCSEPKYVSWTDRYLERGVDVHGDTFPISGKYVIIRNQPVPLEEVVVEGMGSLNYNDVLNSSCYLDPYYTFLYAYDYLHVKEVTSMPITVGGAVPCLECGMDCIEDSAYMRCPDCELECGESDDDCYTYCSCCDSRVYYDDTYTVEDEAVCDYCFNKYCFVCDECGEAYFKEDNLNVVKIGEGDSAELLHVCADCYDDIESSKEGKE
jgi:hypothetical protein